MSREINEKCAVSAALFEDGSNNQAAFETHEMLFAMQHRGAEASGIASLDEDGELHSHGGEGLVRDIYTQESLNRLLGGTAIGHNRYSTNGSKYSHIQPVLDKQIGFSFAHNGNLPITDQLESFLERHSINHIRMNDSEMTGNAIAQLIRNGRELTDAVESVYPMLEGVFSCVAMHNGEIVAFRDSRGIRPLEIGQVDSGLVIASETCGLDIIDAEHLGSVGPGEMVTITQSGIEKKQLVEADPKLDIFEFVYFARHDSYLNGKSVNQVRKGFGLELAGMHPPAVENHDNVLVVPVPDTSVPASESYAKALGLDHEQAILKNRYVGRTFMQQNQRERQTHLRRKHNMLRESVEGRDIVIIDDSIVRFNTLPRIVRLAHELKASSVSVLIASPPVRFPDFYGIDTPTQGELAAANMTVEEMRRSMEADYLGFLSMGATIRATGLPADQFNLSCFTGEYPISIGRHAKEISKPTSMEYID